MQIQIPAKNGHKDILKSKKIRKISRKTKRTCFMSRMMNKAVRKLDCVDLASYTSLSVNLIESITYNLKRTCHKNLCKKDPFLTQTTINIKMRAILLDWLHKIHKVMKFKPRTFFMAVNLIDRYLQAKVITKDQLQLLGLTCLFISVKFEELHPPKLKNFLSIFKGQFTMNELISMETDILMTLNFSLVFVSALDLIDTYCVLFGQANNDIRQSCVLILKAFSFYGISSLISPIKLSNLTCVLAQKIQNEKSYLLTKNETNSKELSFFQSQIKRVILNTKQFKLSSINKELSISSGFSQFFERTSLTV